MTNEKKDNYTRITSTHPIDDDIVIINNVKYQRVEPPKPQTLSLYDALELPYHTIGYMFSKGQKELICNTVRGWLIDHTVIETEDEEKGYIYYS
jgi:hypothetical protein